MIIPNPAIMMSPKKTRTTIPSTKSGSKIEAKKLLKNRKVMETLETWIA
jgi:hypothetical protein